MSDSVRPHRWQPTRLCHFWDLPGKNTGVGCHFLLQCMKVKSESEVAQSCPTPSDPIDCSLPGSSVHGIFQARVLEWGAIAFSKLVIYCVLVSFELILIYCMVICFQTCMFNFYNLNFKILKITSYELCFLYSFTCRNTIIILWLVNAVSKDYICRQTH